MTRDDPKALRALALEATPGEWRLDADPLSGKEQWIVTPGEMIAADSPADARYIAAVSPPVVLGLLDRLERAEAEAEAVYRVRMELAQRDHEFCQALGRAEAAEREVARMLATHDGTHADVCHAERDEWRQLAAELRTQESRIMGALCDARDLPTTDMVEDVRTLIRQRDEARAALAPLHAVEVAARGVARLVQYDCRYERLRTALAALDAATKGEP